MCRRRHVLARSELSVREVGKLFKQVSFEELPELLKDYADDPRLQVQHILKAKERSYEHELNERQRVLAMYALQRSCGGKGVVVGVDEVGRGALAGPLTVAAVILPLHPPIWGLNDSKQLSAVKREDLAKRIKEVARAIGIAHIKAADIDRQGMGNSLRQAMAEAVKNTGVEPDCVLIDGNPIHAHPKEKTLVKGDARVADIAAASIVAKVTRDQLMVSYDSLYPQYHLGQCKGYGSAAHIEAIRRFGLSPIHRASFCTHFTSSESLF
jgi:ribonuclease HII